MYFGSRGYTGGEGEDEIKNDSEVSNLSHYEGCKEKIEPSEK